MEGFKFLYFINLLRALLRIFWPRGPCSKPLSPPLASPTIQSCMCSVLVKLHLANTSVSNNFLFFSNLEYQTNSCSPGRTNPSLLASILHRYYPQQ